MSLISFYVPLQKMVTTRLKSLTLQESSIQEIKDISRGIFYILTFRMKISMKVKVSHSFVSDSLWPHGLYSPCNSPGQNTGVGSLSYLQGIFPIQWWNPGLPHCRWIFYQLSWKGSQKITIKSYKTENVPSMTNFFLINTIDFKTWE